MVLRCWLLTLFLRSFAAEGFLTLVDTASCSLFFVVLVSLITLDGVLMSAGTCGAFEVLVVVVVVVVAGGFAFGRLIPEGLAAPPSKNVPLAGASLDNLFGAIPDVRIGTIPEGVAAILEGLPFLVGAFTLALAFCTG